LPPFTQRSHRKIKQNLPNFTFTCGEFDSVRAKIEILEGRKKRMKEKTTHLEKKEVL
jgi:hypothetical protein